MSIFVEAPVVSFAEARMAFQDAGRVFHPGANSGRGSIGDAFGPRELLPGIDRLCFNGEAFFAGFLAMFLESSIGKCLKLHCCFGHEPDEEYYPGDREFGRISLRSDECEERATGGITNVESGGLFWSCGVRSMNTYRASAPDHGS